jgi:ribosomal protein S18 acetylase RimI-like enzyme
VELRSESRAEDLGALLRETYEDTLDCPGLADLRRDEDILDGHRRGGNYDPELWTVLFLRGRPAGAALLNRVPASGSVELTYLGLAKWARGKGLGSVLLDAALVKAATVPERIVSLAVDERNTPAERLYRSRGFRTVSRRRAFAIAVDSST